MRDLKKSMQKYKNFYTAQPTAMIMLVHRFSDDKNH